MHLEQLHIHKRKRDKGEKPDKKIHLIDNLVLLVAIIYPLTTIPQIIEIWVVRNATGVSLLTWFSYLVLQSILLAYGIVHKEKKLILMWGLWIVMYVIVVLGLILYQ